MPEGGEGIYGRADVCLMCFEYQRSDVLRAQTGNLEIISITYNHIQNTLLPVEFPLIENRFKGVDEALKAGFEILNWNSHKIDDYIGELMATVKDLSNVLLLCCCSPGCRSAVGTAAAGPAFACVPVHHLLVLVLRQTLHGCSFRHAPLGCLTAGEGEPTFCQRGRGGWEGGSIDA